MSSTEPTIIPSSNSMPPPNGIPAATGTSTPILGSRGGPSGGGAGGSFGVKSGLAQMLKGGWVIMIFRSRADADE